MDHRHCQATVRSPNAVQLLGIYVSSTGGVYTNDWYDVGSCFGQFVLSVTNNAMIKLGLPRGMLVTSTKPMVQSREASREERLNVGMLWIDVSKHLKSTTFTGCVRDTTGSSRCEVWRNRCSHRDITHWSAIVELSQFRIFEYFESSWAYLDTSLEDAVIYQLKTVDLEKCFLRYQIKRGNSCGLPWRSLLKSD